MTLYILTCINEELEIVDQKVYTNYHDAYDTMQTEYERERSAMLDDIVQDDIFDTSATLVYGDQPYQYEWKLTKVEA